MRAAMTPKTLQSENHGRQGTSATSAGNRSLGFRPAFRDDETGRVYPSCFLGGVPAPFHVLDGLPDEVVLARDAIGRAVRVKPALQSGFLRDERFYTRAEAQRAADEAAAAVH